MICETSALEYLLYRIQDIQEALLNLNDSTTAKVNVNVTILGRELMGNTFPKRRIQFLEILESSFPTEKFTIDDHRKVNIKNDSVVYSETEHDAHQRELGVTLE